MNKKMKKYKYRSVTSLDCRRQAIIFVPFLPFPARNPTEHDIIANFHMNNHIRSPYPNRLILQLSV